MYVSLKGGALPDEEKYLPYGEGRKRWGQLRHSFLTLPFPRGVLRIATAPPDPAGPGCFGSIVFRVLNDGMAWFMRRVQRTVYQGTIFWSIRNTLLPDRPDEIG